MELIESARNAGKLQLKAGPRADWIEALRSGKYMQTTGYLAIVEGSSKGYCCLGVACEKAVEAGVIAAGVPHGRYGASLNYGAAGEDLILPVEVQEYLGIDRPEPVVLVSLVPEHLRDRLPRLPGEAVGLSGLNDTYGFTFTEIADVLEAATVGVE